MSMDFSELKAKVFSPVGGMAIAMVLALVILAIVLVRSYSGPSSGGSATQDEVQLAMAEGPARGLVGALTKYTQEGGKDDFVVSDFLAFVAGSQPDADNMYRQMFDMNDCPNFRNSPDKVFATMRNPVEGKTAEITFSGKIRWR